MCRRGSDDSALTLPCPKVALGRSDLDRGIVTLLFDSNHRGHDALALSLPSLRPPSKSTSQELHHVPLQFFLQMLDVDRCNMTQCKSQGRCEAARQLGQPKDRARLKRKLERQYELTTLELDLAQSCENVPSLVADGSLVPPWNASRSKSSSSGSSAWGCRSSWHTTVVPLLAPWTRSRRP